MRRRLLLENKETYVGINASEAVAGDICLYSKRSKSLIIVSQNDFDGNLFQASKYSPVGIVVVPGTHNVYGTNTCAVVSLKNMSCETPDNGTTNTESISWGDNNTDISGIRNRSRTVYINASASEDILDIRNTIQGTGAQVYLPTDTYPSGYQNPYDTDTWYAWTGGRALAPSPYNEDDTRNSNYKQDSYTWGSTEYNVLADFDGKGNTQKILACATAQTDWKTASSITKDYSSGYYPAACCCWRYHTEGTKQGDWYLPGAGEWGYLAVKLKKISTSVEKLKTIFGSENVASFPTIYFWTSTETNYKNAIRFGLGAEPSTYYTYKSYTQGVRPFIRVNI